LTTKAETIVTRFLAIETSCDETAAVFIDEPRILSSIIAS
jgi:tRNA A37 threonylcarbamoyltransferase TsaD